MEVLRMFALVNTLAQLLLPYEGNCMLLGGIFTETENVSAERYKTRQAQSCAECATMCLQERVSPWYCGAYSCSRWRLTCDLYVTGTEGSSPQEGDLYLFQVNDVFHSILINGHTYSIYLSSALKTFNDAKTHCENMDSHLFHFDSLDDYEAIKIIFVGQSNGDAWLVGADGVEGVWLSAKDGMEINETVLLWEGSFPISNSNSCAAIVHKNNPAATPKLQNVNCNNPETFLCQRDTLQ